MTVSGLGGKRSQLTYRFQGRDYRLTDVPGEVVGGDSRLELLGLSFLNRVPLNSSKAELSRSNIDLNLRMKTQRLTWLAVVVGGALLSAGSVRGEGAKTNASIFPDKRLEAAVRKVVFEKRDNQEPITAEDVANLSTINGSGMQITDLTGLENCRSLGSLDLAKNQISDLGPIKGLVNIQYLNLAENRIEDITPLKGIAALQYIELSSNRVRDLEPLTALTNMSALYLSRNQLSDITPLLNLSRLSSLYLDHNKVREITGLNKLRNLSSLSLAHNQLTDLSPLIGLDRLHFLFLENNELQVFGQIYEMVMRDLEGEQRFAPFVNIYVAGNPLEALGWKQIAKLKDKGVKIEF